MKKFLLSIFALFLAIANVQAEDVEATLSFASTAQRTSQTTAQQVWEQNGITFTNNKASSTTNVANYSNPVRLYAKSEVIINAPSNISKIVFTCSSSSYATALKNSIVDDATASGSTVTVTLDGSSDTFTIASLSAQVRVNSLTVTYSMEEGEVAIINPTIKCNSTLDNNKFVGSTKVEITDNNAEGTKLFYSTDGEGYAEYTEAFTIDATTIVYAYAEDGDGNQSSGTSVEFTRVAADPVFVIGGDASAFEGEIIVTITIADGATAYYTLNGETPTNNSTECPSELVIKADATLKVIAYEEDGLYMSNVVEQVFKMQSESTGTTATLVTSVAGLAAGEQVVIVASDFDVALSTNQKSNNRGQIEITKSDDNTVELNDNVQVLTLEEGTVDGTFAFNTGSGYLYAASSSKNYLKTQPTNNDNGSWKIEIDEEGVATIKAQGANTCNWLRYNESSSLFSCYSSGQQDVSIYKVDESTYEDYEVTITNVDYATFFASVAVNIPDGVEAYYVKSIDVNENGKIELTEIEGGIIPANTAVILKGAADEYTFSIAESDASVEGNKLKGTNTNEYLDEEAYVLGVYGGEVGLYKAEMAGGVWLNNANKAYLPASAGSSTIEFFGFDFEGTTGIENVEVAKTANAIYDLTGRRVEAITEAGIYIVGGKKVLVK